MNSIKQPCLPQPNLQAHPLKDSDTANPHLSNNRAQLRSDPKYPTLPVFGLDEIGKRLRLLVSVVIVVAMAVVGRSDVLHLVDAAAFGATLDRSLAGHL